MKVVVTGGAGFIGANLCRVLAEDPAITDVVAVDDLSTGKASNLAGLDITLVEGSVLDARVLEPALVSADCIVHLAALPSVPRSLADPMTSHQANASGTVAVLEGARKAGVGHVLVASSSSVYGGNRALPKHEDLVPQPLSPYAASKLASEAYAFAFQHCFGLDVLVFRLFNVFGPLQDAFHPYAAGIPIFIAAALAGRPVPVHGDGLQTRDFTFVDTVTTVLRDAVVRRVSYPAPVNLAFGGRTDLLTVLATLEEILGAEIAVEHREPRGGDVRDSQADPRRLQELFGDIAPVDLLTGLRRTVEWSRDPAAARVG